MVLCSGQTCENGREYGFCEESKIGKEEKDRLTKIRTNKALDAATKVAVPEKTLKGCECDLWSSHNGYTDVGAAWWHDIGNGKWYVFLFT